MVPSVRRESAPNRAGIERIVVGASLVSATNGPTAPRSHALVHYVFPDAGAAMLGAARSPTGLVDVTADGVEKRTPAVIWLRDLPWFVDAWGVQSAGRLERRLSDIALDADVPFVSWLEGHTGGLSTESAKRAATAVCRETGFRES